MNCGVADGTGTRRGLLHLRSEGDGVTGGQLTAARFPWQQAGRGLSLPAVPPCLHRFSPPGRGPLPSPSCRWAAPRPPARPPAPCPPRANGGASSSHADPNAGVPGALHFQGGSETLYQACPMPWMQRAKRNWIFKGKRVGLFARLLMALAFELRCPTRNNRTGNTLETFFFSPH